MLKWVEMKSSDWSGGRNGRHKTALIPEKKPALRQAAKQKHKQAKKIHRFF
jgi:hypothetical protein